MAIPRSTKFQRTTGDQIPAKPTGDVRRTISRCGYNVRTLRVTDKKCFVYADRPGVFEPLIDLGSFVTVGQPVARVHNPERIDSYAHEFLAEASGFIICERNIARCENGDCLIQIGQKT